MDDSDSLNIASENLRITGNIGDNKRYLNKILYCMHMYSESFDENHKAIGHPYGEI